MLQHMRIHNSTSRILINNLLEVLVLQRTPYPVRVLPRRMADQDIAAPNALGQLDGEEPALLLDTLDMDLPGCDRFVHFAGGDVDDVLDCNWAGGLEELLEEGGAGVEVADFD